MKRTIPVAVVGSVLVASAVYMMTPDPSEPALSQSDKSERSLAREAELDSGLDLPAPTAENTQPANPELRKRWVEIVSRRGHQVMSEDSFEEVLATDTAWTVTDEPAEHLDLTPEDIHDGREFISFDRNKVETLMPGDELVLPVEQLNTSYTMVVTEVINHGDGNISWHGQLKGESPEHVVSITQGEKHTFVGMTTPEGHYSLEVFNTDGWIVNTGTLAKHDGSEEDFLIPESMVADNNNSQTPLTDKPAEGDPEMGIPVPE